MSDRLIYKTLAEVKLLHEFYLTESTGKSIFDFPGQPERLEYLQNNLSVTKGSLEDDLRYDILSSVKDSLKSYGIRLAPSFSGFRIVTAVRELPMTDGSIRYVPNIAFPTDLTVPVIVRRKSTGFNSFTNSRYNRNLPAVYYFSNNEVTGSKTYPYLTSEIPAYSPARDYELGELALHGANDARAYYSDDAGKQWLQLNSNAFANESDRILLPLVFKYVFDRGSTVTNATFTLLDEADNTLTTIETTSGTPFSSVQLDFSQVMGTRYINTPFILEARVNNDNIKRSRVVFTSDPEVVASWALISIKPFAADSEYRLFDYSGFLKTTKSSSGDVVDTPVFEIPIKSRMSYWRYMHDGNKKLKLSAVTAPLLDNKEGVLVSKLPRIITSSALLYATGGVPVQKFLPCPANAAVNVEQGIFYSNISVGKSDIFPLET